MLFQAFFARTAFPFEQSLQSSRVRLLLRLFSAANYAEETFMASPVFLAWCSVRGDILDSANLPPFLDVSTPAVAVRALARVSAQLSTPARDRGDLALRGLGPRGRASSDGWAASGVKLRARGRPGCPAELFCCIRLRRGVLVRLAD